MGIAVYNTRIDSDQQEHDWKESGERLDRTV